ncbi:chaperone protein DnaK [Nitzschia inconspicua]|uniref:Chaperone protein DnaK n=1 Tax=Nitzschia inconspicua TaxID=303405 RepID=A0A9K3KWM9_9STRA|nr:chaperone protein DnaK [Nitzschia inconspicua]
MSTKEKTDLNHEFPSPVLDGIWIGIDLGTSNSACAVWDSTRGSSKWMRLPNGLAFSQQNGKIGRIMPSVVRWEQRGGKMETLVGASALKSQYDFGQSNRFKSSLLQSVKRLLGKSFRELDREWMQTLDFDVLPPKPTEHESHDQQSLRLVARTSNSNETITTTPEDVLAEQLKALRNSSQVYLDRCRVKKRLKIPGCCDLSHKNVFTLAPRIRNVVVGVPAHFSQRHIELIKSACRKAGFDGHVGTCLESTAAAMAYGLTMQETTKHATIMVVDMGGGTTDITVVTQQTKPRTMEEDFIDVDESSQHSSCQVLLTRGDEALGGDDIDQAIMDYCIGHSSMNASTLDGPELREKCRKAKEALCKSEDPSSSEAIALNSSKQTVVVTQHEFVEILQPWLQRAKDLIVRAKLDLESSKLASTIDEVVLVGGTTRIPVIRSMIQEIFPTVELSTSLNPMSSVAQGLAIEAAIMSKDIPLHELKSALMLDCVPHAIGVELPEGKGFVEIIPRNTSLPAKGSAIFTLADKNQAGVTLKAVEKVGVDRYEPMSREEFTFLLRRLTPLELKAMNERSIHVGMKVDIDGKFIVSIFDENDPEQVRKKEWFERRERKQEAVAELGYIEDLLLSDSDTNMEQLFLSLALFGIFVIYIAVKIAFANPVENESSILG